MSHYSLVLKVALNGSSLLYPSAGGKIEDKGEYVAMRNSYLHTGVEN